MSSCAKSLSTRSGYLFELEARHRGLCGLSLKAARQYVGNVEVLERGSARTRLDKAKALKMARTYNAFICSIIRNSTEWTKTVIAPSLRRSESR
jgi:hypothetical protein